MRVNTMRAQAVQEMPSAIDAASQGSRDAVALFGDAFDALTERWDVLHADYDQWRVDGGGCDRQAAVEALGGFVLQIGEIADVVRALSRAVFLRPLGELYVEAAEQAQEAFKGLRNGWQPFDLSVYATLESERSEVGRLRRQVDAGIQDLLARYDIPIQDLEDLSSNRDLRDNALPACIGRAWMRRPLASGERGGRRSVDAVLVRPGRPAARSRSAGPWQA